MGPDGDVHRVKAVLNGFHGKVPADGDPRPHRDAGGQDVGNVPVQDVLGQAIVGDAVAEHAAQLGALLIDGDLVAHERQVVGRRQAARPAADDGHCLARVLRPLRGGHVGHVVHGVPLQAADVHRVVHHPPAALALAGVLAHIGAGGGEGVVLSDEAHRVLIPPQPDEGDVPGDVHMGRAGGDTGHRVAQAADAPAVEHVLLVVLPEAPHPPEHHVGRLIADGTVGGVGDHLGGALDEVDGLHGGGAVQHLLDEHRQLAQANPAGHALAAGLGVAQPQEVQGHVHRTKPRLAGADAPAHVPVQVVQYRLGPVGDLNG